MRAKSDAPPVYEESAMLDRRLFLTSATATAATTVAGLSASSAAAQVFTQDGAYGTPGPTFPFPPQVYAARRRKLAEMLDGGVAVVFAATKIDATSQVTMAGNGLQDQDFAWLTGIQDEANAAIILSPSERHDKESLHLASRNLDTERWEGERLSVGAALRERTGFDKISGINSVPYQATMLAAEHKRLVTLSPITPPGAPTPKDLELFRNIAARGIPGVQVVNRPDILPAMRAAKEPREIELIEKAVAATAAGHLAAMRAARPGMNERELMNIIENAFREAGAERLAFPSIVGAGRSGATVHYMGRDNVIRDGDLVLNDIGSAYRTYASDITRTFPVSGTFSPAQRAAYEAVLDAQMAAAKELKPGTYYQDLNQIAIARLEARGYRDDFWHGLGHFVGLDVHDVGDYRRPLPENAVVTIEPGVYRPQDNFGIRIEDMFRTVPGGNIRMSEAIPYRPDDVEAAVRSGR